MAFTEDLQKLGRRLEETHTTYQESMKKLSDGKGNLVRRAESIRELGAKVKKRLPQNLLDKMREQDAIEE